MPCQWLLWVHILIAGLVTIVCGNFNLLISPAEMKRLLGLSKELYYVREGVVNEYALNFEVTVPPQVDNLEFTWQALGQKPLSYWASLEWADSLAMHKPTISIPAQGFIPTLEPITFQLLLPCTGDMSDEVPVRLKLAVMSSSFKISQQNTTVILRRKKICLEDPDVHIKDQQPVPEITEGPDKNINGQISVIDADSQDSPPSELMYIILICSFGMVAFVMTVACVTIHIVKSWKYSDGHGHSQGGSRGFLHEIDTNGRSSYSSTRTDSSRCSGTGGGGSVFLRPPDSPHHYSIVNSFDSEDPYYSTLYSRISGSISTINEGAIDTFTAANCQLVEQGIAIPRCQVRLQSVLMEGTFAKIYSGTLLQGNGEQPIIVKTVLDDSSAREMTLLLQEGLSLVGLRNDHLLNVERIAVEDKSPPFLIYQHSMGFRNLKLFLQDFKRRSSSAFEAPEIVQIGFQIASGLEFLHQNNIIHGDIATRNCIVDDNLHVKIWDGALASDLFPSDYHCWDGVSRPIKWMSPEAIINTRTAVQSDIWSFGVLLWEIATFGDLPYAEIEVHDLIPLLRVGYRLSQPNYSSNQLYSIMQRCWAWESGDRPKSTHILSQLKQCL